MTLFMSSANSSAPLRPAWEPGIIHHRYWKCHTERGALVVTVTRRFLFDDVLEDFFEELTAAIGAASAHSAIVDFRQVEAVAAASLEALDRLGKALERLGGRLILSGLSEPLVELFHLAELSGTPSWRREVDALAALGCVRRRKTAPRSDK
jgi:anti-anti-sigma regulatory factor